jgi:threonine synthase
MKVCPLKRSFHCKKNIRLSYPIASIVLAGLAPNGGLYIPERILRLPQDGDQSGCWHTFQLSVAVLSLYISPEERASGEIMCHPDGPKFAFKDVALELLRKLCKSSLARQN